MSPSFPAGSIKRRLEMVLYDPAAASQHQQCANKRARQSDAAAMVPHAGAILDVAPINAIPPLLLRPPPPRVAGGEELPPCLRRHFLVALGLRADLPVHYIDHKYVTSTDMDPHQNRFRIPSDGVERRLRPILSLQELDDANLLHDPPPVSRKRPRQEQPDQPQDVAAGTEGVAQPLPPGKTMKKPKKKGKVHGGLRVKLVDLDAGAKELKMSRWDSSHGTVVKGEGYLDFIRRCSFREGDDVDIWAFVQRRFRLFGADVCDDSLLHVLVVKKQTQARCRYCPAPALHAHVPVAAPTPSPRLPSPHLNLDLCIGIPDGQ